MSAYVGPPSGEFAADLLRGAGAIAEFLFGDAGERRKVYHLSETSNLPVFKLGALLCARRSTLLEWVADQERKRSGVYRIGGPSGHTSTPPRR